MAKNFKTLITEETSLERQLLKNKEKHIEKFQKDAERAITDYYINAFNQVFGRNNYSFGREGLDIEWNGDFEIAISVIDGYFWWDGINKGHARELENFFNHGYEPEVIIDYDFETEMKDEKIKVSIEIYTNLEID